MEKANFREVQTAGVGFAKLLYYPKSILKMFQK